MEEKKVSWVNLTIGGAVLVYLFGAPIALIVMLWAHEEAEKEAIEQLDARISYALEEDRNHFEISQAGDERISEVEIDRIWDELDWRWEHGACMRMWWWENHGDWCEKNVPGWHDDDPADDVDPETEAELEAFIEADYEAFKIYVLWEEQMLEAQGICWSER